MNYMVAEKGSSRIVMTGDRKTALATFALGADIAIACYNNKTGMSGISREMEIPALCAFFDDMLAGDDVIHVHLIGGDNSQKSRQQMLHLLSALELFDGGRNCINLVSADINAKPHPDSFEILDTNVLRPLGSLM